MNATEHYRQGRGALACYQLIAGSITTTITFSQNSSKFPRALIDGLPIESVDKTKLLGVTINSSLTWNDHIEDLVKKAFRKLYFLVQLKRAQIPPKDLVAYYCACIRSTLDYACPLFHHSVPKYLQLDLERVQKRALSRIFPRVPYCEALKLAQIESIRDHQNHLTKKLFHSVVNDPSNKLYALLPTRCKVGYNLRRERKFAQPLFRTKKFADSFVNRCVSEEIYS